jgi:glycosyltransferase involved in cell wall biosynthesis
MKKVSVLIPAYNSAKFIGETLRCVLGQDYGNLEVIVLNDASTDNTVEVVKSFSDSRIKLFHNERNLGLAGVRNRLLELATGDLLAWQDSDDLCSPDRIAKQMSFLRQNPEYLAVGSGVTVIDEDGREIHKNLIKPLFLNDDTIAVSMCFEDPFTNSSMLMRKNAADGISFDMDFPPYEDYDFWEKVSWRGKVANLPDKLIQYRRHGIQTSKNTNLDRDKIYHGQIWSRRLLKIGIAAETWDHYSELHWEITRGNYWKKHQTLHPALMWFTAIIKANRISRVLYHRSLVNYLQYRIERLGWACPYDGKSAGIGIYALNWMHSWSWSISTLDFILQRLKLAPSLIKSAHRLRAIKYEEASH